MTTKLFWNYDMRAIALRNTCNDCQLIWVDYRYVLCMYTAGYKICRENSGIYEDNFVIIIITMWIQLTKTRKKASKRKKGKCI